jgi:hypothetical protein
LQSGTPTQDVESGRILDGEQQWIEKYRAAISHRNPPHTRLLKLALAALTLAAFGLSSALYLFSIHFR